MRLVQVAFCLDPLQRPPEELFAAWATLREVAAAAARELSFDAIGSQLRSAYETLVRAR